MAKNFKNFFFKLSQGIIIAVLFLLPLPAFAVELVNPIKNPAAAGNNSTVVDIVVGSFVGFATLIAVFAFGFLVISGLKMIISRGNPEAITNAKNSVAWSVLGLGAAILSVTIIFSVQALIGGVNYNELDNPNELRIPIINNSIPAVGSSGEPLPGFLGVFVQIVSNIAGLAFLVCVLMVVWAGYTMIFSGGNEEKITSARTILAWALAGAAVIILSYMIIFGVNRVLVNLPNAGTFTP